MSEQGQGVPRTSFDPNTTPSKNTVAGNTALDAWRGNDQLALSPKMMQAQAAAPNQGTRPSAYQRAEAEFGRMSTEEKSFLLLNPYRGYRFMQDGQRATDRAKQLYPPESQHNGEGDAFRHAYWNALMTRHGGADKARQFADARERREGGDERENQMDLHNNRVGREIALANPNASPEDLSRLVQQALAAGKLVVLN